MRKINRSDNISTLEKWTNTVSNFNKNNEGTYNQNLINKGGALTAAATGVGTLPLTIFGGASVKTPNWLSESLNVIGLPSNISLTGAVVAGGSYLTYKVGTVNKYAIIYDVKYIHNGKLIEDFKDSNTSRKEVLPTSFQGAWKRLKSKFK